MLFEQMLSISFRSRGLTKSAKVGKRLGSGEHFQKRLQKNVAKHRSKVRREDVAVPVVGFGECYASPEGNRKTEASSNTLVTCHRQGRRILEEDPPIGPCSGYLEPF